MTTEEKRFQEQKIKEWVKKYNFNEKQAKLIYDKAFELYHSIWSDMINFSDDVAEWVKDVMEAL